MALTKISTAMISQSAAAVDLNVDAGTFYVDTTNNRVGVGGKTDPDTPLHVVGTATATLFAGSGASLTSIPNAALVNSSITINSTAVSLGGSLTLGTDDVAEGSSNLYYTNARADARIAAADTDDLSEGSSNLYYTDARVDARVSGGSLGNITTTGYIRGPATFTLDPAAHGDDTGTVVIAGNLQVDGTTTTINSTTMTVDDKNITLASGSANAAAADGAGFTVDIGTGTNPAITYDGTNDEWDFNKPTRVSGLTNAGIAFSSTETLVDGSTALPNGRIFYHSSRLIYDSPSSGHRFAVAGNQGTNIAMVIDSSQRVGIGTTSPTKKLTVFGTGAGNATVQVEGEGGADPYINFLANNTQHWSLGIDDSDADKFKLSEHSALGTNDYFVVDVTGKVGIGTASPVAPLHIQFSNNDGGVGGHLIKNTNTGTTSNFASLSTQAVNGGIQGTFGSAHYAAWGGAVTFAGSQTAHPFKILTGNSVRATFDTSGNVGIGTASPATVHGGQVLQVSSSTGADVVVHRDDAGAELHDYIGGFLFYNGDTSGSNPHYAGMIGKASDIYGSSNLEFYAGRGALEDHANAAPHMIITGDSGNNSKVGIGTSAPANKLHVKAGASGATTFDSRYNLTLEDNGENYLGIYAPNNSFSGVRFLNADNSIRGHIDYYLGTQGDKFVMYSQNGWDFQYPSVGLQQQFKSNGNVNLGATHSGFSGWRVLNIRQSSTGGMVNFDENDGTRAFTFANQGVGMRYQAHITGGYHRFETHALGAGTAMMITDAGSVGIGTTSPDAKLDIEGTLTAPPSIRLTQTGNLSQNDVTGKIEFYNSDTTDNTAGVFGIIQGVAGPSGGEGSLQFLVDMPSEGADANNVAMHINANGNVGIGTDSPEGKLHVEVLGSNATPPIKINRGLDGGRIQLQYSSNETGYGEIGQMYAGTGRTQIWIGANLNSFSTGHNSSPLQHDANYASWFSDWDSYRDRFTIGRIASGTTSRLMLIDSSGNVGIGTASPGYKLEISDDTNGTVNLLRLRNADSTYSQTWDFQLNTGKHLEITGASGSGGIVLNPGTAGTTVNSGLYVVSNNASNAFTVKTDHSGNPTALQIGGSGAINGVSSANQSFTILNVAKDSGSNKSAYFHGDVKTAGVYNTAYTSSVGHETSINILNNDPVDGGSDFDQAPTNNADGGSTTWSISGSGDAIYFENTSGGHGGTWMKVNVEEGYYVIKGTVRLTNTDQTGIHPSTSTANYKYTHSFRFEISGGPDTGHLKWDADAIATANGTDFTRAGFCSGPVYMASGNKTIVYNTNGYNGVQQIYITNLELVRIG